MRKPLLRQPSSVSSATDYNDPADWLSAEDSALRLPGKHLQLPLVPGQCLGHNLSAMGDVCCRLPQQNQNATCSTLLSVSWTAHKD